MTRTYNVNKYVIQKNYNNLKLHRLRLYKFNTKDGKVINISKSTFVKWSNFDWENTKRWSIYVCV